MKKFLILFCSFLIIGCSNYSPNERQKKNVLKNYSIFEQLIKTIEKDTSLQKNIFKVRKKKLRGDYDLIFVKNQNRLINAKEIKSASKNLKFNSLIDSLENNYCIRGIRFDDNKTLIIEINQFKRHTLTEKYTKYKTLEIHRLVPSNEKVKYDKFAFRQEIIKWKEPLNNYWNYEISQVKL